MAYIIVLFLIELLFIFLYGGTHPSQFAFVGLQSRPLWQNVKITYNILDQQSVERFSAKRSSQAVFLQRVHHHYLDWAPLLGRLQCPNQTCDSSDFPAFAVFGFHGEKNDFDICVWSLGDDGASNHHCQHRHGHQLQTAVTWVRDELERNPKIENHLNTISKMMGTIV